MTILRRMNPIIWSAIIAGGVSVAGNVGTSLVAKFGRDAQREQITTNAGVELAKVLAEAERVRDERREVARRERADLYARTLAAIARLERYGEGDLAATDEQYQDANREWEDLHEHVLLSGTDAVQAAMEEVLRALFDIGGQMARFDGGPAERFRSAYRERTPPDGWMRGTAVTRARGALIATMRDDVTAPHLPK